MAFENPWGNKFSNFNRWASNKWKGNPWGEDGKFYKTAIDDESSDDDSGQTETGNLIELTDAFKNSPAYRVYSRLLENSVYQKFIAPFKINEEHNLKIDFQVWDGSRWASADTVTSDIANIVITVNGNFHYYQDQNDPSAGLIYRKKPADIFIAKTLIHEAIHAYIAYGGFDYPWVGAPGPVQEHNFMATEYRDDLLQGITEFAEENNINISTDDLDAITWAGLDGTVAFSQLPVDKQTEIKTRFGHFDAQVYWFQYGKLQQDDATTYGGNLPSIEQASNESHIPR